jgi:hypothetical protein
VPLGVELRDGSVVVNPHRAEPPFDAADITAIFAVGDMAQVGREPIA